MGRLLWAIQSWYAEMENEERHGLGVVYLNSPECTDRQRLKVAATAEPLKTRKTTHGHHAFGI